MKNNPFEVHGIDHLSASSINTYISDPAMWCMRYLFDYKHGGNPAMWRGTCVDHAVGHIYGLGNQNLLLSKEEAIKESEIEYLRLLNYCKKEYPDQIIDKDKYAKEKKLVPTFAKVAIDFYGKLGTPTSYQREINLELESIPVPIKGYIDLQYEDIVRDIKTTMRYPYNVTDAHARQVSVYAKALGSDHAILDYIVITSKAKDVISKPVFDIDDHIKAVEDIALAIMNLLSYSNEKTEIAKLFYPNFESWMWGEDEIKYAKSIWSIK